MNARTTEFQSAAGTIGSDGQATNVSRLPHAIEQPKDSREFRRYGGVVAWGVLLSLPVLAFLFMRISGIDPEFYDANSHLLVVVIASGIAALIAMGVLLTAGSFRDPRIMFLVLGYVSLAAIFACHGLATPFTLHDGMNPAVGNSVFMSMFAGSFFIALSVFPFSERMRRRLSRHAYVIAAGILIPLAVYVAAVVTDPTSTIAGLPGNWVSAEPGLLGKLVNLAAFLLLAFAAARYLQAYLLARLPGQFVAFLSIVLLAEAQVPMAFGELWYASWWLYHGLLWAACALIVVSWAWEFIRSGVISNVTESLLIHEGLQRVSKGYPGAIHALNASLEAHDPYTLGHTNRVAEFALEIASTLRLSPTKQRACTLVAQLHDIGKVGTPHHILNKPGSLTDEEFEEIKTHTSRGFEILGRVAELAPIRTAVRAHHERFDGSGYPDGLQGRMIPIEARVVSVADVFDALTSDRPYRSAWSAGQAFSYIQAEAGKQFDPAMVAALERVLIAKGHIEASRAA
jgi:putative nucleotidyltransferase with HDIG domain